MRDPSKTDGMMPAKDAWEEFPADDEPSIAVEASISFAYVDTHGQSSTRNVDVRELGHLDGMRIVVGRCRYRQATRTFRVDRMTRICDLETGEVVSDLTGYLNERYRRSEQFSIDNLQQNHPDLLNVVFHVARLRGQLRADDRERIGVLIADLAQDRRLDGKTARFFGAVSRTLSVSAFRLAVGRVARGDARAKALLLATANEILSKKKNAGALENEMQQYLASRLG